jgi:hypothetical protein
MIVQETRVRLEYTNQLLIHIKRLKHGRNLPLKVISIFLYQKNHDK